MPKINMVLCKVLVCSLVFLFAFAGKIAPPPEADVAERYKIDQKEREAISKWGYFGVATEEHDDGLFIYYMDPAGPAVKSGFKYGDIIIGIDGKKIKEKTAYSDYMSKTKAGQELIVTIFRDGKKKKLAITLDRLSPGSVRHRLQSKLGVSWRDMAAAAYNRKDYDEAIKYYDLWLYADPQDDHAWYDLACTYALKDDKEKALECWEYAVDAGWTNTNHALNDKDLEIIRDEERFKHSLKRCEEYQNIGGPKKYERNFIKMQSLGTYIAMLPPDYEESEKEYPLCIILHGGGSTETDHGNMADKIGRDDVIYIAPRFSYPHVWVFTQKGKEGWTSWPQYDFKGDKTVFPVIDDLNVEWIFSCADNAKERYRVAGDKVFMVGHCLGAYLAHACAAHHPEVVKSYFAYAGNCPDYCIEEEALNKMIKHDVKPYFAHCADDKLVDPEESIKTAKAMEAGGLDCVLKIFESSHFISADVYSFMREWLEKEAFDNKQ